MIPYKLAKQLKEAGYDQEPYSGYYIDNKGKYVSPQKTYDMDDLTGDRYYIPTLEELIEWCGDGLVEETTLLFHDTYESLAPDYGYKTRKDTMAFDPNSKNGRLMLATVTKVLRILHDSEAVAKLGLKLHG